MRYEIQPTLQCRLQSERSQMSDLRQSVTKKPYRFGIALSGGGARGFAHIGALKALEEAGLKPDVLAGVSAGSVAAVLYSSGMSCDSIIEHFSKLKFRDLSEFKMRGGGFFSMERFTNHVLKAIHPHKNIEELPIPTYIGATDFDNGLAVAFDKGSIKERIAASCSIPVLFHPVEIDGVRYVDGGVLRNVPSWILRDKCETLIGINCSPLDNRKVKNSIFDVAIRSYNLMLRGNTKNDMDVCDVKVELPEIVNYKVFDLKGIHQVYLSGYSSTRRALKNAKLLNNLQ